MNCIYKNKQNKKCSNTLIHVLQGHDLIFQCNSEVFLQRPSLQRLYLKFQNFSKGCLFFTSTLCLKIAVDGQVVCKEGPVYQKYVFVLMNKPKLWIQIIIALRIRIDNIYRCRIILLLNHKLLSFEDIINSHAYSGVHGAFCNELHYRGFAWHGLPPVLQISTNFKGPFGPVVLTL